jgi:hypothetical protein
MWVESGKEKPRGSIHMNKFLIAIVLILASLVASAAPSQAADIDRLVGYMCGSFSSAEQAMADPDFYDLRLVITPIWKSRSDGHWLYVEQASASRMNKPYRQRVYHITRVDDTTFRSDVFDIEERERFVGAWSDPNFMEELAPDSLIEREGCAIILYKVDDTLFEGGTRGTGCLTNYRDAVYRISDMKVTPSMLYRWDRGYSAEGEQLWGAVTGGYEFKRESRQ